MKKEYLLVITIIAFLGGIIYFLNFFNIITWFNLDHININKLLADEKVDIELFENQDLFLLREEENKKLLETISIQKKELDTREEELAKREIILGQRENAIIEEQKKLELEKQALAKTKEEQEGYEAKVDKIAEQFINMPPEQAVERIVALEDDILIIDILKTIDQNAADEGNVSIVPFFYSLMPQDIAARIIRKSSISF